tara:strand:+ start:3503 stop:4414 length:912 start_codon:yes stop_codon:yes gene_type:complete
MCGCLESGVNMVDHIISHGITISYFVSLNSEQAKKHNISGYHSFEDLSKKYNIPIYYPHDYSLDNPIDVEFFEKNNFDLLILGGWNRLIPKNILDTLRIGGLGIHGSSEFLPKGRGRASINWSLIEDKKCFILHLFLLTKNIDDGDVLDYKIFDINEWDTCRTLYYKFSMMAKRMLEEQIPKILENNFKKTPQGKDPSFYPKRNPDDGIIYWSNTVFQIYNFIRALTKPYPGAFAYNENKKIYFWKSQPFDTRIIFSHAKKGEVVEKFSTGDFVVNCKSGLLLITDYDGEVNIGDVLSSEINQ